MDGSSKIALAIVASAAIVVATWIGYREFSRRRDLAQGAALMQQLSAGVVAAGQQQASQEAAQRWRDHQANVIAWDRRLLMGNQRCVGGVVVIVNGSSYSQLGSISNPVHCSGRYADRAIR